MSALTEPQYRALRHLASVNWCSPSSLGEAMSDRKHLRTQGAGRLGGTMGTRLCKMGLAQRQKMRWRDGELYDAGYAITESGRHAIARHERTR